MLVMKPKMPVKGHILITGGTGFIGSYLSNGLLKAGYKVTTVSRSASGNKSHICADLTNKESLVDLGNQLSSVDTIIHCAAIAHGEYPPNNCSVSEFNTSISNNLIEVFGVRKLRWIFISSISVYGDLHLESEIPLTQHPKPVDSYGLGKLFDESSFVSNCCHLDILRLMPVYDNCNLQDIRKRVFLPNTDIKVMIHPYPLYSICNVAKVLTMVLQCMKYKSGQRISQVGDSQPASQKDLVSCFPGKYIVVPQFAFRLVIFLLPKRISLFRNIRFMLKKFGLNNIYEVGSIEVGIAETSLKDFLKSKT